MITDHFILSGIYPKYKKFIDRLPEEFYISYDEERDILVIGLRMEVRQRIEIEQMNDKGPIDWQKYAEGEMVRQLEDMIHTLKNKIKV